MCKVCLKILPLLLLAICTQAHQECTCMDNESGAQWGEVISVGNCTGDCKAGSRNIVRSCQISSTTSVNCSLSEACTNQRTCPRWYDWANEGPCIDTCGGAMQLQKRICYVVKKMVYIRSKSCPGSNGASEQARNVSCLSKKSCNFSTNVKNLEVTTSPTLATTITTPTSAFATATREGPTTITSKIFIKNRAPLTPSSTFETTVKSFTTVLKTTASVQETIRYVSNTKNKEKSDQILETNVKKNNVSEKQPVGNVHSFTSNSNLTLPLVISSVALICVAVIISFVIIFKRNPNNQVRSDNSVGPKDNNNETKIEVPHNYEDVGPALPPMRRTDSKPVLANNGIPLTVKNALYGTSKEMSEDSPICKKNQEDLTPKNFKPNNTNLDEIASCQKSQEETKSLDKNAAKKSSLENVRRKSRANKYTASKKLLKSKPAKVKQKKNEENCDDYVKLTDLPIVKPRAQTVPEKPYVLHVSESRNSYCNDGSISAPLCIDITPYLSANDNDTSKDASDIGYVTLDQLKNKNLLV